METIQKIQKKPTPRQKKAAKAIIKNATLAKPKYLGEVLQEVGYGKIGEHPARIIESQGFKQALRDLGLTEELITTSLVFDIENKPKNRLGELRLGAEILGINKREDEPEKREGNTTYNFIFSPNVQAEIKKTDDLIKAQLIKNHVQEN